MPRNSSMISHKKPIIGGTYNCGLFWYDVFSLHCSSSHQCVTYCSLQCPYYVSALQVKLMFSNAVVTMYSWSLALPLWHFTKRFKAKLSVLSIKKPSSSWEFSTFVSVLSFIFHLRDCLNCNHHAEIESFLIKLRALLHENPTRYYRMPPVLLAGFLV